MAQNLAQVPKNVTLFAQNPPNLRPGRAQGLLDGRESEMGLSLYVGYFMNKWILILSMVATPFHAFADRNIEDLGAESEVEEMEVFDQKKMEETRRKRPPPTSDAPKSLSVKSNASKMKAKICRAASIRSQNALPNPQTCSRDRGVGKEVRGSAQPT